MKAQSRHKSRARRARARGVVSRLLVGVVGISLSGCAPYPKRAPRADNPPRDRANHSDATPQSAPLKPATKLRFMVPSDPGERVPRGMRKKWREIEDASRIAELVALADNEAARFALTLYKMAWDLASHQPFDSPTIFIGIEPEGNFGRFGFTLVAADGRQQELATMPFLILDANQDSFRLTLLHEMAHAIHWLLIQRDYAMEGFVAPIPHSTAAITDRRTAFNEGLAIHLETTNAHCGSDPDIHRFYQRREARHGSAGIFAEYYAPARDLLSYSQDHARYSLVRDGLYAFEPAIPAGEGDYLRVQLTPDRNRRALRSPGALVASEGFIASVLFHTMASDCADLDSLLPRYRMLFAALKSSEQRSQDTPLIALLAALWAKDRTLGERAIRAFLDLSRGVTVDAGAAAAWAAFYDAALHLEIAAAKRTMSDIEARRRKWQQQALADPQVLARRLGPVVVLQAAGLQVGLPPFGPLQPLAFDVNAAGRAMLGLVPGLGSEAVATILRQREKRPFADADDFFRRLADAGVTIEALSPRPAR